MSPTESFGINVFEQVVASRGMVLMVLLVLIGMSLGCWFIIGIKGMAFRRIRRQTAEFLEIFWKSETLEQAAEAAALLPDAPIARVYRAAFAELNRVQGDPKATSVGALGMGSGGGGHGFANVERTLRRALQDESSRLEQLVPFLATTGSAAPFIGLFGTVWGIMNAFAFIQPDKPILETVTPHIAQALVATAIGLLAAIPAVVAYNYFTSKIRVFAVEMENFSIDFLNILRRHFLRD
jgi:biopolymer transport protein TolQ